MQEAPLPPDDLQRLAELRSYAVLDTVAEQAYDDLTRIASHICGAPIALVSLVDENRQWFKSRVGLDAEETPRRVAFCAHAILEPDEVLVVPDSLADPRFHDNPLATGEPHVRFYAGAPLVNPEGQALGTLCVIDHEPRELSEEQLDALRALSRQVVSQLELRKSNTELQSISGELESSNRELQQFTSIAAHDLQEPLRKLVSFTGLLRQDLGEDLPDQAAEDLRFIVDASDRMQQLVHDLLDLSRAGSREIPCSPVRLNVCVGNALDALSVRIEETGAEISVDALPEVVGNETLLTQLFQNLICNALKFAEDRPEVRITYTEEDGELVVGVKDDGIGMDPRYAEQVFEPFKRLHGRDEYEGTGIGLAVVRKVAMRHGGRAWVESVPGEGCHFKVTLHRPETPAISDAA
jgi:signal transduction histidine kinase